MGAEIPSSVAGKKEMDPGETQLGSQWLSPCRWQYILRTLASRPSNEGIPWRWWVCMNSWGQGQELGADTTYLQVMSAWGSNLKWWEKTLTRTLYTSRNKNACMCVSVVNVSLFNFLQMLNDPLVHSNGGHVEARQHLLRLSNINNYSINGNSVNNNISCLWRHFLFILYLPCHATFLLWSTANLRLSVLCSPLIIHSFFGYEHLVAYYPVLKIPLCNTLIIWHVVVVVVSVRFIARYFQTACIKKYSLSMMLFIVK